MKRIIILLLCLTATASAYKVNILASYTQDGTPTAFDSLHVKWYWQGSIEDSLRVTDADSEYVGAMDVDSFGQYGVRVRYFLASGKRLYEEYERASYGSIVSTFDADGGEYLQLGGVRIVDAGSDTAALFITDAGDHAVEFKTTAATKHGLYTQGNTSGDGIHADGGTSGSGIVAAGGATNGDGIRATGQGTGEDIDAEISQFAANTITAAAINADAITEAKIADAALVMGVHIDTAGALGLQVEAELRKQLLNKLVAEPDTESVVDNSVLAKMAAVDGDWSDFDSSLHSLEALRVRGDAAWATGAAADSATMSRIIRRCVFGIELGAAGSTDSTTWSDRKVTIAGVDADAITDTGFATSAIDSTVLAADAIGESEIATGAITGDELAATAVAEISDAVWDEEQDGHTSSNTFGNFLDTTVSSVSVSGASVAEIQTLMVTTIDVARDATREDYWGSVGGTGAYSVTLTARDTVNDLNIADAIVSVYNTAEDTRHAGPKATDIEGDITVNLDNGDYAVTVTSNNVTWDTDTVTVSGATVDTIQGYGVTTISSGTAAYAVVQGYLTEPGYEYGAAERTAAYWDVRFTLEDVTGNSADIDANKVVAAKSYVDTKTNADGLVRVHLLKTGNMRYKSGLQTKEPTWTMVASPADVLNNPIISLTFKIPADSSSIDLGLLLE